MRRRKNNDIKNFIIALIFLVIVFMTAGYAAYSRDLVIKGTGKIVSDWDVEFTNVELDHASSTLKEDDFGDAIEVSAPVIAEDGLSMNISVALVHTTDQVTYDIDITNFSEAFDAKYVGAIISADSDNDFILYEITGITVGDKIAADTSSGTSPSFKTVTLRAYWNPSKHIKPNGVTKDLDTTYTETATITLAFEASKP